MAGRKRHALAHPDCAHASWAACDKAAQVALGQCRAMVGDQEPNPCSNWAVNESGYCGQHYASAVERERKATQQAAYRAALDARIDAALAHHAKYPSVHD